MNSQCQNPQGSVLGLLCTHFLLSLKALSTIYMMMTPKPISSPHLSPSSSDIHPTAHLTSPCKHNLECNVCQKNLLISILLPLSVAQAKNLDVAFDSSLSPATSHLSRNSVGSTGPSHRSLSRGCRQYPPKSSCFYPVCPVSPLST